MWRQSAAWRLSALAGGIGRWQRRQTGVSALVTTYRGSNWRKYGLGGWLVQRRCAESTAGISGENISGGGEQYRGRLADSASGSWQAWQSISIGGSNIMQPVWRLHLRGAGAAPSKRRNQARREKRNVA